ncbi:MAG TPA: hypothetical protein VFQ99_00255, partial [Gallionella sp.]|nr:hypothetical protein [Gallionella sp.]
MADMALYSYRAIDDQGKTSKGMQDAANVVDLELRLKHGGLDLIDAKVDSGWAGSRRGKIKRPELITFFFQPRTAYPCRRAFAGKSCRFTRHHERPPFPRNHR